MSITHAASGEVIDLATFGPEDSDTHSVAVVKTDRFETMRMFVQAGSKVDPHTVDGPITVQCLRGDAQFFVGEAGRELRAGSWLYLDAGVEHSIEALSDCVLLVNIMFKPGRNEAGGG